MLRAISVDFDAGATSFAEFATGRMTANWEAMQTAETAVFGHAHMMSSSNKYISI
jgi:hypothetical protein